MNGTLPPKAKVWGKPESDTVQGVFRTKKGRCTGWVHFPRRTVFPAERGEGGRRGRACQRRAGIPLPGHAAPLAGKGGEPDCRFSLALAGWWPSAIGPLVPFPSLAGKHTASVAAARFFKSRERL